MWKGTSLANEQRYRFASDDDGHNYLILDSDTEEFEVWLANGEEDGYEGVDFNDHRIDSEHFYTFTDPREDV